VTRSILALLLVILITSCYKEVEHSDKTVFSYNQHSGITSLDPAFSKDQANIWVVNQMFNGLVQMDERLEVIPCIAKRWTISADGLTYMFYLREGVYFHESELFQNPLKRMVTAHDFVYSFNRIISPKVASPGAWIFNDKVVLPGQRPGSAWAGLKKGVPFVAENDTTFKIYLTKPFPPMLGVLTMQYCSVVPYEIIDQYGKDFRNHPIGTGPFKFKMWEEGVKLVLTKNENYFERDNGVRLPYLDAVTVTFLPDRHGEFFEFLKGKLDFFSGVEGTIKDEILTKDGFLRSKYQNKFTMSTHPYLNTQYIGILVDPDNPKVKNHPLRLKKVRQAIAYGIDRKRMITYLKNNIGYFPDGGFVPKGLPSFNNDSVQEYNFDPYKSVQLLAEAGFTAKSGMPEIKLSMVSKDQDLCEFIQQQLSEIGFKVELEIIQSATLREMRNKSELICFRSDWLADYADGENFLALFYSKNFCPGGPNFTHFKNERFDELYELAKSEVNDEKRYQYYHEMDQIVMEEAPVIVLYYNKVVRLVHNHIEGLGNNAINLLNLKKVKINKDRNT